MLPLTRSTRSPTPLSPTRLITPPSPPPSSQGCIGFCRPTKGGVGLVIKMAPKGAFGFDNRPDIAEGAVGLVKMPPGCAWLLLTEKAYE
ncbi:hypothetical protein Tco_1453020 [Tanacetum coccineum]